jgi:hypothetical protein
LIYAPDDIMVICVSYFLLVMKESILELRGREMPF